MTSVQNGRFGAKLYDPLRRRLGRARLIDSLRSLLICARDRCHLTNKLVSVVSTKLADSRRLFFALNYIQIWIMCRMTERDGANAICAVIFLAICLAFSIYGACCTDHESNNWVLAWVSISLFGLLALFGIIAGIVWLVSCCRERMQLGHPVGQIAPLPI